MTLTVGPIGEKVKDVNLPQEVRPTVGTESDAS